jgi:hypothetical protein
VAKIAEHGSEFLQDGHDFGSAGAAGGFSLMLHLDRYGKGVWSA